MRVTCETIDDFFANILEREVFDKSVWVNIQRRRADDGRSREPLKHHVVFQASVVAFTPSHQFFVDLGIDCGIDYHDGKEELNGTKAAEECMRRMQDFAAARGWRVLPGVLGYE